MARSERWQRHLLQRIDVVRWFDHHDDHDHNTYVPFDRYYHHDHHDHNNLDPLFDGGIEDPIFHNRPGWNMLDLTIHRGFSVQLDRADAIAREMGPPEMAVPEPEEDEDEEDEEAEEDTEAAAVSADDEYDSDDSDAVAALEAALERDFARQRLWRVPHTVYDNPPGLPPDNRQLRDHAVYDNARRQIGEIILLLPTPPF